MSEVKHFSVEVSVNHQHVLTIETGCVFGLQLSKTDEEGVRIAAEHLLAFVGKVRQPPEEF